MPEELEPDVQPSEGAASPPDTGLGSGSPGAELGVVSDELPDDPAELKALVQSARKQASDHQAAFTRKSEELAEKEREVAALAAPPPPWRVPATAPPAYGQPEPETYGYDPAGYPYEPSPPIPPPNPLQQATTALVVDMWANNEIGKQAKKLGREFSDTETASIKKWLNDHVTTDVDSAVKAVLFDTLLAETTQKTAQQAQMERKKAAVASAPTPTGTPSQPTVEYPPTLEGIQQAIADADANDQIA